MKGVIKVNKFTKGHGQTLKNLGYEVRITEVFIEVEAEKIWGSSDLLDLTKGNEPLKRLVAEKHMLSYKTPVRFQNGKIGFGLNACRGLDAIKRGLSALVCQPAEAAKELKETPPEKAEITDLNDI